MSAESITFPEQIQFYLRQIIPILQVIIDTNKQEIYKTQNGEDSIDHIFGSPTEVAIDKHIIAIGELEKLVGCLSSTPNNAIDKLIILNVLDKLIYSEAKTLFDSLERDCQDSVEKYNKLLNELTTVDLLIVQRAQLRAKIASITNSQNKEETLSEV